MSFIVKGFDIPKDAVFFKLSFYNEDSDKEYGVRGSLKPYTIQIPKKHGRLIDVSELIKSYMKGTKTSIDDFYDTIDIIDNIPTILEAEE